MDLNLLTCACMMKTIGELFLIGRGTKILKEITFLMVIPLPYRNHHREILSFWNLYDFEF